MALVRFVSFTFGRDAESTIILADHLVRTLGLPYVVIDDAANPFLPEEIERLKATGAVYKTSSWKRGGNLNGKDAVVNILTDLLENSDGVSYVAKIDVDTYPCQTFIEALESDTLSDVLGTGNGNKDKPFFGALYAFRKPALEIVQIAAGLLPWGQWYPEDRTISRLALASGLRIRTHLLAHPDYHKTGVYIKWGPSWAVCFGFVTDFSGSHTRTKEIYGKFVADKLRQFIQFDTRAKVPGELLHSDDPPVPCPISPTTPPIPAPSPADAPIPPSLP